MIVFAASRFQQMKQTICDLWKRSTPEAFQVSVQQPTAARMHWLGLGILIAVGAFTVWNTAAIIKINHAQQQLRTPVYEFNGTTFTLDDADAGPRGTGESQKLLADGGRQISALSMRATISGILGSLLAVVLFVSVIQSGYRERVWVEERRRDLARFVQASRTETVRQSDRNSAMPEQQAEADALRGKSRPIHVSAQMESVLDAADQPERSLADEIDVLGQQARELARSVESSRIQTLHKSDEKIEALGLQARDLARTVESSRVQTLKRADAEIELLEQQALDLASFVESSHIETLNEANKEIRELAEGNDSLEQRVLERTAQLEAANNELDSFSYSVSHDLRAPLRAIDGFSRIVLEDYSGPMADEGKAYLQLVRDNTRQMGQLIDDLLAFARFGRQALTRQSIEVGRMVRRCLEEMSKDQAGRHVEIIIGDLCSCNADPALLKQVWTNLLANALKFTRKQETARIEIGCRTQSRPPASGNPSDPVNCDPEIVYFVRDNGAGFDMQYADKLFGVFQRLHSAAEYEGTGVGLAIVQRVIQRHGGRVWGEAAPNEGATFSFTLA